MWFTKTSRKLRNCAHLPGGSFDAFAHPLIGVLGDVLNAICDTEVQNRVKQNVKWSSINHSSSIHPPSSILHPSFIYHPSSIIHHQLFIIHHPSVDGLTFFWEIKRLSKFRFSRELSLMALMIVDSMRSLMWVWCWDELLYFDTMLAMLVVLWKCSIPPKHIWYTWQTLQF